jgi:hypothetical protein
MVMFSAIVTKTFHNVLRCGVVKSLIQLLSQDITHLSIPEGNEPSTSNKITIAESIPEGDEPSTSNKITIA